MKALLLSWFLFLTSTLMAQSAQNLFYKHYESYRQKGLENRRFRQQDILPMIHSLKDFPEFEITKEGESVQGLDIFMVKIGQGKNRILLWSQMHGDEPTATMALMDICNFFKDAYGLDSIRHLLLEELSLYIIPMLNPDGAEVYQRRNALGIDLNRDALRLQSPEALLLKSVRDRIQASWGFNLHDQNILYSAGKTPKPATISFLAPPFDEKGGVDEVRSRAIKLIVEMNNALQPYIPGQVGKWPDEFEPRAFGENMQKWGTSTVLIESGGYKGDPEKQYIRKLNFVAIMQGLLSIATHSYVDHEISRYNSIPENERRLFNLLIRNVLVEVQGKEQLMDIGINRVERPAKDAPFFYSKSSIEDLGDLSTFYGYEELDASGMRLVPGQVYPVLLEGIQELQQENIRHLLRSGYTSIQLRDLPKQDYIRIPVNMIAAGGMKSYPLRLDEQPNFVLKKQGETRFAIINGFLYDLHTGENRVENALVEKE